MPPLCSALLVAAMVSAGPYAEIELTERGLDPSPGVLLNYTTGVPTTARPDPTRPTIVVIHGSNVWHPVAHWAFADRVGEAILRRYGPAFNVLGWDWNGHTIVSVRPSDNVSQAAEQGRRLAAALAATGIPPERMHLIGQSAGTIVAAAAARELATRYGRRPAQLSLIDAAKHYQKLVYHDLEAGRCGDLVENFWVGGPGGFGNPIATPGVRNLQVNLGRSSSYLCYLKPMHIPHLDALRWYISTIESPGHGGFDSSVVFRLGSGHARISATSCR